MQKLASADTWEMVGKLSKRAARRIAAVAYVTSEKNVRFEAGDHLVVDASDDAVIGRQTDRDLIARLVRRGVNVVSLDGLHAKIMVLGKSAVVGSANLSRKSEGLHEAVVISQDAALVAATRGLVGQLGAQGEIIDEGFIQRIMKLVLDPPRSATGGAKRPARPSRVWLVGTGPIPSQRPPDEDRAVESGLRAAQASSDKRSEVNWIRFGSSRSRFVREARRGDRIIHIDSSKTRAIVWRDVYLRKKIAGPGWSYFFVEYLDDDRGVSWGNFAKLWRRTVGGNLARNPVRMLAPGAATALLTGWEVLDRSRR